MKTVWTLTVKTSLPNVCESEEDLKVTKEEFANFEDAKKRMREVVKELAFENNAMFDGDGHIKNFQAYINNKAEYEEDGEEGLPGLLNCSFMNKLHNNLRKVFSGEDVSMDFMVSRYTDMFILVDISSYDMDMRGDFDGPINGVLPKLKTNIFDMSDEKDYYLYIDDFFGGLWDQELSAELYIDLNKIETE